MKTKRNVLVVGVVMIALAVGLLTMLNGNKIEKSLKEAPTFYIFGYDSTTQPIALNEDYSDEVVTWNPVSIGIILNTDMGKFTAIYDGLDSKLTFVEELGSDGVISSHFVKNEGINVKENSLLKTYLDSKGLNDQDFLNYIEDLYQSNNLKSKYDTYKLKFSKYIQSQN